MDLKDTVKQKRMQIIELASKFGVHNVRLFGSVARGESDDKSDIDFLVTIGPKFSLMDHVRLEQALEQLLGHKVDIVSDGGLKRPRFRDRVLNEAMPL